MPPFFGLLGIKIYCQIGDNTCGTSMAMIYCFFTNVAHTLAIHPIGNQ